MNDLKQNAITTKFTGDLQLHIFALEGMIVSKWYRGLGHSLHIEFGELHEVVMKGHLGMTKSEEGDYSLFLHGAWILSSPFEKKIRSGFAESSDIDRFLRATSLGVCTKVIFDYVKGTYILHFEDGLTINIKQEDSDWFVLSKYDDFAFSPKDDETVEFVKR